MLQVATDLVTRQDPAGTDCHGNAAAEAAAGKRVRVRTSGTIDLFDLAAGLWRQRRVIAAVPVLMLAVAGCWLLVTPPVYESRAVMEIGRVPAAANGTEAAPIEVPRTVAQRLREQYQVNGLQGNVLPRLSAVEWSGRRSGTVLVMRAQAASAAGARAELETVVAALMADHSARFETKLTLRAEHVARLRESRDRLEVQIDQFTDAIEGLRDSEPVQASLLTVEASEMASRLSALDRRITQAELAALPPVSQPSRLLSRPDLRDSPVHPARSRVLAMAALLGLIVGVGIGLLRELLTKRKAQQALRAGVGE